MHNCVQINDFKQQNYFPVLTNIIHHFSIVISLLNTNLLSKNLEHDMCGTYIV